MMNLESTKINSTIALGSFILVLLVFGFPSCKNQSMNSQELKLDSKYDQIKSIHAFAHCQSPQGDYTTETTSLEDGTFYFKQISEDRSQPFSTKLSSGNEGFVLDENDEIIDTLPELMVEMIRSHDFHRIHTNPGSIFSEIGFDKDIDDQLSKFKALDNVGNSVSLYYNKKEGQIIKIELLNPLDTTELIEVTHKKWMASDYGPLVKEVEIIQAGKDTFYFDFEYVHINK